MSWYRKWWNAKPWWWRLFHRVWWRVDAIYSAVVGRPGPGDRYILHVMKATEEAKELEK